jgi:hypothetical protein
MATVQRGVRLLKKSLSGPAPVLASALLLAAIAPVAGQDAARRAVDPEANAGARLAAAMSTIRGPVAGAPAAQQAFIDEY